MFKFLSNKTQPPEGKENVSPFEYWKRNLNKRTLKITLGPSFSNISVSKEETNKVDTDIHDVTNPFTVANFRTKFKVNRKIYNKLHSAVSTKNKRGQTVANLWHQRNRTISKTQKSRGDKGGEMYNLLTAELNFLGTLIDKYESILCIKKDEKATTCNFEVPADIDTELWSMCSFATNPLKLS